MPSAKTIAYVRAQQDAPCVGDVTLDAAAILSALSVCPGMSTRAVAVRAGFGVRHMKACARELDRLERLARVWSQVIRRGKVRKRFWHLTAEAG